MRCLLNSIYLLYKNSVEKTGVSDRSRSLHYKVCPQKISLSLYPVAEIIQMTKKQQHPFLVRQVQLPAHISISPPRKMRSPDPHLSTHCYLLAGKLMKHLGQVFSVLGMRSTQDQPLKAIFPSFRQLYFNYSVTPWRGETSGEMKERKRQKRSEYREGNIQMIKFSGINVKGKDKR